MDLGIAKTYVFVLALIGRSHGSVAKNLLADFVAAGMALKSFESGSTPLQ
jgi:hypothetical protein